MQRVNTPIAIRTLEEPRLIPSQFNRKHLSLQNQVLASNHPTFPLSYICLLSKKKLQNLCPIIAGMVPKSTCEIPKAGEAGPAEIHVPKRHRSRQRSFQSRRRQREGRRSFSKKSSDATRQLEQRDVYERGETNSESESRERETHQRHGYGRKLTQHTRK